MSVTVIIPFVEDRGYLQEAIDSVKNQTYKCKLLLSQSNNSVGYNLNNAIEKCTTDYWVYLCDDDILPIDSIERRLEAMAENDFIHGKGIFMDGDIYTPHKMGILEPTFNDLMQKNHIFGGTCMYRTSWHKRVQWNEELWTGEELDYHLNLLKHGAKIGFCDEFVYLYRKHENQKSNYKTKAYTNKRKAAIKKIREAYE